MKLTAEQRLSFGAVTKPLMKWLAMNCSSEHYVIVANDSAKLVDGLKDPCIDRFTIIDDKP